MKITRRDFLKSFALTAVGVLTAKKARANVPRRKNGFAAEEAQREMLERRVEVRVRKHGGKVRIRINLKREKILAEKEKQLVTQIETDLKNNIFKKTRLLAKFKQELEKRNYFELEKIVAEKEALGTVIGYIWVVEEKSRESPRNIKLKKLENYYAEQRNNALRSLFLKLDRQVEKSIYSEKGK